MHALITDPKPWVANLPEGLPDLTALPRLAPSDHPGFIVAALAYWQLPVDSHHVTRQLRQELRLRDHFLEQATLQHLFGGLAHSALQLVEEYVRQPRWQDRVSGREAYSLHLLDDSGMRSAPLAGFFVISQRPAGVDYALGHVTERQAATGQALLYNCGEDGYLKRFDHLQAALDSLTRGLVRDRRQRQLVLARQAPLDQMQLLKALADGRVTLVAVPLRENLFSAVVAHQVAAWKACEESAQASQWNALIGLDVSCNRWAQRLRQYRTYRDALRGSWPRAVREPDPALDALVARQWALGKVVDDYFGPLPSFQDYARGRVSAELAKLGLVADVSSVGLMVHGRVFSDNTPLIELAPSLEPDRGHSQESSEYVSMLEYLALRVDRQGDGHRRLGWVGLSDEQQAVFSFRQLDELAARLRLEEGYQAMLSARLVRPAAARQGRFDTAKGAALDLIASQLRLAAQVHFKAGLLDASGLACVMHVLDYPSAASRPLRQGRTVQVQGWVFDGNSARDVFFFSESGESSVLLYTPGYPGDRAFIRHSSFGAARAALERDLQGLALMPSQWSPAVHYWVGRFGGHQQNAALRLLQALAKGKAGAELKAPEITGPWPQFCFDYRTRFLLAEADSQSVSHGELAREHGLAIAALVFRVFSVVVPGRLMTALDLAELAYLSFSGYAAYAAGQREEAADYLLEALSSVSGLANANLSLPRAKRLRVGPSRLQQAAATPQLTLSAIHASAAQAERFTFSQGPRRGLYVVRGALYVRLENGLDYQVYEVRDALAGHSTFRLGDGLALTRTSVFSNPDPLIVSDGAGRWRLAARAALKGGMNAHQNPRKVDALYVLAGVRGNREAFQQRSEMFFTLRADGLDHVVKYDLNSHQWFCADNQHYYRLDRATGRFVASHEGHLVASPVERQMARRALGCSELPPMPPLRLAGEVEPLPPTMHQVWIGSADELIARHGQVIDGNSQRTRLTPTTLTVHVLPKGGVTSPQAQLEQLRERFKYVKFLALENEPFFKAFLNSRHAEPFEFFLQAAERNYAAACDVLRYRLMFAFDGTYLDLDDELLEGLPALNIQRGQVFTGGAVSHVLLGLDSIPNNSHFATLKANPLMDAVSEELLRRFAQYKSALQRRPWAGDPTMVDYMSHVSRTTGPAMFNDVLRLADPRHVQYWQARRYLFELELRGVIPEQEVIVWARSMRAAVAPLEGVINGGSSHSWLTGR